MAPATGKKAFGGSVLIGADSLDLILKKFVSGSQIAEVWAVLFNRFDSQFLTIRGEKTSPPGSG